MIKLLLVFILLLSSCSKKVITEDDIALSLQAMASNNDSVMEFPEKQPTVISMEKFKTLVTVYFKFDSYEIQKSEEWKMSNISQPVELIGGCCPIGTDDYNYTLGLHRAMIVREYLKNRGIEIITYKSVGKRNLVTADSNEYGLNRRCEIRY
jgi:outer membrane protein OmpA-like peptidoglycan-associated protein